MQQLVAVASVLIASATKQSRPSVHEQSRVPVPAFAISSPVASESIDQFSGSAATSPIFTSLPVGSISHGPSATGSFNPDSVIRSSPEQLEVTQNEEEGEEENLPDPLAVTMREVLLQFPQRVGGEVHVLLLRPLPAGALKLIKVTRPSTEQMLVFHKEGEEEEHNNQPELQNMSLREFLLQSSQLVNAEVSVLLLQALGNGPHGPRLQA